MHRSSETIGAIAAARCKVSDEFTVPLCRTHHREVHRCNDESQWWSSFALDPFAIAARLWAKTRPLTQEVQRNGRVHVIEPQAPASACRNRNGKTNPIPKDGLP
jgi:hypothetical protein